MNPCLVPGLKAELLEEGEHMAVHWEAHDEMNLLLCVQFS